MITHSDYMVQLPVCGNSENQILKIFQVSMGRKIFPVNNSVLLLFQKKLG